MAINIALVTGKRASAITWELVRRAENPLRLETLLWCYDDGYFPTAKFLEEIFSALRSANIDPLENMVVLFEEKHRPKVEQWLTDYLASKILG